MFNIYLVGINIIGLMTIILDKIKSIKKKWRIPEKNFIIISMAGGGIGIIIDPIIKQSTRNLPF